MENISIQELEMLAKRGDAKSIKTLAEHYHKSGDDRKAFAYLSFFEYVNDIDGMRTLAKYLEKGLGTPVDLVKAKSLYNKAYEAGDLDSGYLLAKLYVQEGNYEQALPILTYGVCQNHILSIKFLASLYAKGEYLSFNEGVIMNLYKKLVDLGEHSYYDKIGKIYYNNQKYAEAIKYFEKGSWYNLNDAMYHLGIMYARGQGTYIDIVKALDYYERGARLGHEKCLYNLYLHYSQGIGVKKDKEKAEIYLKRYENCKKSKN